MTPNTTSATIGVRVAGFTFRRNPENGSMLSRAIEYASRAWAPEPTTRIANIEKMTNAISTFTSQDDSQYPATTSSGVLLPSTAAIDGIATVKPISATMPRTAEPATAQSTPRGTLRRGLTASSDMSAASSKPTSVNAPSSPASANEYSSGLLPGFVVLARIPNP